LKALRRDQFKQVAEWEFGEQPPNTNWEKYFSEMEAPQWAHFGLYDGGDFIGCVSFERIDPRTMAYHVVTRRHSVRPHALAQVLLKSAGFFFQRGFTSLVAKIPREKRAAARLAIRCGMKEEAVTDNERNFILTKNQYERQRVSR